MDKEVSYQHQLILRFIELRALGIVQELANSDLPIDSGYVYLDFIQLGRGSLTSGGICTFIEL